MVVQLVRSEDSNSIWREASQRMKEREDWTQILSRTKDQKQHDETAWRPHRHPLKLMKADRTWQTKHGRPMRPGPTVVKQDTFDRRCTGYCGTVRCNTNRGPSGQALSFASAAPTVRLTNS